MGAKASLQGMAVFNWRSGELSFTGGIGAAGEVGTPKGPLVDLSGGILLPKGYSSNDMLLGPSIDLGFGLQADAIAKAGLDAGVSFEMAEEPATGRLVPAYDPESRMQPVMINLGPFKRSECGAQCS